MASRITTPKFTTTLSLSAVHQAAVVGIMRSIDSSSRGRQPGNRLADHGWAETIEGAIGEMALAKAFGVFWAGMGTFKGADVGQDIDVKTSSNPNARNLLVKRYEPEEFRYVFVTLRWLPMAMEATMHGWMHGSKAKKYAIVEFQKDRPCHAVPMRDLLGMHTLRIDHEAEEEEFFHVG